MSQEKRYLSYLLRLWQEGSGNPPLWRASLESPRSGERQGFASLAELFCFLENEVAQEQPGASTGERGGATEGEHYGARESGQRTDDEPEQPQEGTC